MNKEVTSKRKVWW